MVFMPFFALVGIGLLDLDFRVEEGAPVLAVLIICESLNVLEGFFSEVG